jgi:hypothetical protein
MAMLGVGKTKFHELINAGLIEVAEIDGMPVAVVSSLERLVKNSTKPKPQESQTTT